MKILFWLVGNREFKTYTVMTVKSLKKYFNLPFDVVVLSDHDSKYDYIKFINCKKSVNDLIKLGYKPDELKHLVWRTMKPNIIDYVNIQEYDYIAYIDSDILINSPEFESMILDHASNSRVVVQQDYFPLLRNYRLTPLLQRKPQIGVDYRKIYESRICSGFISLPPSKINILKEWQIRILSDVSKSDQFHLNHVLLLNNHEYYEESKIVFYRSRDLNSAKGKKSDKIALHFAGGSLQTMAKYYSLHIREKNVT